MLHILRRLKEKNMIRHEQGELLYFSYPIFTSCKRILSVVSSRQGGVSAQPYDSLNLALSVGDDPEDVMINRELLCKAIGVEVDAMTIAQLVQGTHIEVVTSSSRGLSAAEKAQRFVATDGLITNSADIPLFIFIADCAALSFFDPKRHVIGIGHAGWRGAVGGIARKMVEAMNAAFDCNPADILVGISPSIGPCCYQVQEDVFGAFQGAYPEQASSFFVQQPDGSLHLDMWKALTCQLHSSGIEEAHIELSGICTACHTDMFYSNRAEGGKTGRFTGMITLLPSSISE
jgi:purine-nucleoside/S-methyl-5'-thioadenosine phosphorylase / adenosine deaminase